MSWNVIFHVDLNDPQRLNLAFDNVANYMNYLAEHAGDAQPSIVMVGNGPVVQLFENGIQHSALHERARELMGRGLSIRLCSNAIRKFGIDPASLVEGCVVVPAGIPEILMLESGGYGYIKP